MNYPPKSHLSNNTSYNLQDVSTMCRGNKDQILKMVEMFIDQIPKSIEEINTALAKNDIETIKNQLHKSKSTIYFFGASKLADEFITTEAMLSEKFSSSELELKIKNINLLTNEVVEEMKNDFI